MIPPAPTIVTGNPVTITAAVTGSAGTPTGSISFYDGKKLLGTFALNAGAASITLTNLAIGSHAITAVYSGNATYAAAAAASALHQVVSGRLT